MSPYRAVLVRWVAPIVGAAFALAALFALYGELDFDRFVAALETAVPAWLALLVATILLEQWVRGWKWRQILFDLKPVPSFRLFGAVLAGYGATILVPLGISPLVRSWLIARLEGLRFATVLATAAIERFLDGVVFALFAAVAAFTARLPELDGSFRAGFFAAGGLNLILFSGLLFGLFAGRARLGSDDALLSRSIDWLAGKAGRRLEGLRAAIRQGIVWPEARARQFAAVLASVLMKVIATTHFLWAGLAVGVFLTVSDYVFLMVVAGFAMVVSRFVRVPGGFTIGSGFALNLLGVPDEKALAMILFSSVLATASMVGFGLVFLWRSGIDIRNAGPPETRLDAGR